MAESVEESSNADLGAMTASTGVGHDSSMQRAKYTPGSAIIYKGEPTATELGMLRFSLTSDNRKRLNAIVAVVMDDYKELEGLGEEEKKKRFDAVVERIKKDGLATPLRPDLSAPYGCYSIAAKFPNAPEHLSKFVLLLRLLRRLYFRRIGGENS